MAKCGERPGGGEETVLEGIDGASERCLVLLCELHCINSLVFSPAVGGCTMEDRGLVV
jgi:hypothetical protein